VLDPLEVGQQAVLAEPLGVVGRSTPGSVTLWPTRELTSVDLPAPVEPPTTVSMGASMVSSRGIT